MPKPFVLVEVEDGTVSDVNILGVQDMVPIVVDWDNVDGDDEEAQELINAINDRHNDGDHYDQSVSDVLTRLEAIVQAVRGEEEEFDDECDEDEDEDIDAAHLFEHLEGGDEEDDELAFDDEDELDLNENFKQVD